MKLTNKLLTLSAAGTTTLALGLFAYSQGSNTSQTLAKKGNYQVQSSGRVSLGLTPQQSQSLLANVPRGTFNVGTIGHDFTKPLHGLETREVIHSYSQDIESNAIVGEHFFSLPTNFWLKRSSERYEVDTNSISPDIYSGYLKSLKSLEESLTSLFFDRYVGGTTNVNGRIFIPRGSLNSLLYNTISDVDYTGVAGENSGWGVKKYSKFFLELHKVLPKTFTSTQLLAHFKTALDASGYDAKWQVDNALRALNSAPASNYQNITTHKKITIFGTAASSAAVVFPEALPSDYQDYSVFREGLGKSEIKKGLALSKAKLSTLLISVKDGVHNSEDYYKSLVEKNEFDGTNILMIGDKAKTRKGSSSKVFAGKKISTASFNDYLSTYIAGFQSAVSQLKYSKEEKKFEETSVSFFIGSVKNSKAKKKAFAFRRGVEAAASHPSYAAHLKVSFVSKSSDDRTTGKKLYYDANEWKEDGKISKFTGSDEFLEGDRRVIYIAGTTAGDWRGNANDATHNADRSNGERWVRESNFGLIGSILKYSASGVASKRISNLSVVLDKLDAFSYDYGVDQGYNREHTLEERGSRTDRFERDGFKLLGTVGEASNGTKVYSELYLQAVYSLNNANYMLGKHTIFGSPLDLRYSSIDGGKVSAFADFSMERFIESTRAVYSKENTESALIASSPWIQ